jgi:hypothetical protein
MVIQCERSCFYFHQEGTLFVNGQTEGPLVVIGKSDFSDAQNSMKIDHLIVNNGATKNATGVQLNYVLDSDLYIVADSAGGIGLDVRQLQFSVLKGFDVWWVRIRHDDSRRVCIRQQFPVARPGSVDRMSSHAVSAHQRQCMGECISGLWLIRRAVAIRHDGKW